MTTAKVGMTFTAYSQEASKPSCNGKIIKFCNNTGLEWICIEKCATLSLPEFHKILKTECPF